jgi:transposase-like protein
VDRWKHEAAKKLSFAEIVPKLGFSGILGLDEVKPRRSKKYAYIASDVKTGKILYVQHVKRRDFRNTRDFLLKLKSFGLNPHAFVIDMWKGFPEAVSCVFPDALVQYDFFHVMKEVHKPLYAALTKYRRSIKKSGKKKHLHAFLWKNRYKIFTGDGKLTRKDRKIIRRLLKEHEGTIIAEIVEFRRDVRKIFDSKTQAMAVKRRDKLRAKYRKACFRKIIKFLSSKKFEFMTTFLKHANVPRAGNSETMIRTFRQMEKARYGFKTENGLQEHIKLFQVKKYLAAGK